MHKKYSKDGLAVVAVDLDDPTLKKRREDVVGFLEEQGATFTNLVLAPDEQVDDWKKKRDFEAFPYLEIYDRDGKLVKRYTEGVGEDEHKEIEQTVRELLKKK